LGTRYITSSVYQYPVDEFVPIKEFEFEFTSYMYIFIYLINYKRKPRFATNFKIKKNFISSREDMHKLISLPSIDVCVKWG